MIIIVILAVLIVLAIIAVVYVIGIYNSLTKLRNQYKNAYAQIDVQMKRRYDLIPNLVETAKSYMKHERETLEAVIAARNQAVQASKAVSSDPTNNNALKSLMQSEGLLSGSMGRFFAVMENYPDLKANQNMMQLSEELTSTENRIAFARQAFNDSVNTYNISREVFPNVIIANTYRFNPAELFEIENKEERKAPQVRF